MLLRGLRDRLSAYSGIITPITSTLIPEKGEGANPNVQVGVDFNETDDRLKRKGGRRAIKTYRSCAGKNFVVLPNVEM